METIVALDIETTGLDPKKDSIIEIGAIRFDNHGIIEKWQTLINPQRRIPTFITQLTGINNQMITDAPQIEEVINDIAQFIGQSPILGHNINFDLGFFRKYDLFLSNERIDTYELASVLLPSVTQYNLGFLAQYFNISFPNRHRGLNDVIATYKVFTNLCKITSNLPDFLLLELYRLGSKIKWAGNWVIRNEINHRRLNPTIDKNMFSYDGTIFATEPDSPPPLFQLSETPKKLDIDEVCALLEPGGKFAKQFPSFEYRIQQVEMLRATTQALSEHRHLIVEAGTGIGKSMAYLIPAAIWSKENNQRVVISTNTINLQDQLINKDIPDLIKSIGIDLRASVLKGRANYICPHKFEALRRKGPDTSEEMRVIGKILIWLQDTKTGDKAEININGPNENRIWFKLSAADELCTTDNCLKLSGGTCPFYKAKLAALSSHMIIVNHALLLADVATGNRVLPPYDYLIIDEAHHIEDATTRALSYQINQKEIRRILRELGSTNTGSLSWVLKLSKDSVLPNEYAVISNLVNKIVDLSFQFDNKIKAFFESLNTFLREIREGNPIGKYAHQERITASTRTQPAWLNIEIAWEETQRTLDSLILTIGKTAQFIAELIEKFPEEIESTYISLTTIYKQLKEINDQLNNFIFNPDESMVYWLEASPKTSQIMLQAAPIHIGSLMQRYIWYEKSSVIITSATLTTSSGFDYIRERLNAFEAEELMLGSPFDYETSTLLYLVNDIPEPVDRTGFQRAIQTGLIDLCKETNGKILALFTSYDQLKKTSRAISPTLSKLGISIYEQGEGASPHVLVQNFRSDKQSILLGTKSFWEGVDIPGEALSVLVIIRLPFDVPSDPIVSARSETFDDPFYQYSLPEAILRFKQGFGRLIRSQSDRGVVVIFDRRVLTKRYGQSFLDSLPVCTKEVGPLSNLPKTVSRWLNL